MLEYLLIAVCVLSTFIAVRSEKRRLKILWLCVFACSMAANAKADDLQPIPEFDSYLVDQTSWLSSQENAALRKKLEGAKSAQKVHVAVLIVDSTKPEAIEQYSIRVAEKWKVGKKGVDNGVLIVIAKQDKQIRIDVGYGLEGAIPDIVAKRIIADDMTPFLKKGKPYDALNLAIDRIGGYAQKEGDVQPKSAVENTVAEESQGLTGIEMIDTLPNGALILAIVLGVISAVCFFVEEGGVILSGIAIPFIGGIIGIPFFGFTAAATLAIGALVLAIAIRLGLTIGGGTLSGGGRFGGGGASGGWGD